MAVVDRSSTPIANQALVPIVKNNPSATAKGAFLKSARGRVVNAADDSANSIHRFVQVPSNANVRKLFFKTGDATTAGAINVGLYQTVENGGAVVDADLFISALDLTGGPMLDDVNRLFESTEYTEAESMLPLWEVLGLTADPNIIYDVAATISTTYNGAALGQIMEIQYADHN